MGDMGLLRGDMEVLGGNVGNMGVLGVTWEELGGDMLGTGAYWGNWG